MIIVKTDPAQIVLEIEMQNFDGSAKTDISSATVRVYHISGGSEVDDLAEVSLVQVGSTNKWRYDWQPSNLSAGYYIAEYDVTDDDGINALFREDIIVGYLYDDIEILKKIETGRWKIVNNQMVFYDEDGETPLLTFNLLDDNSNPTMVKPYERVPV